VAAGEETGGVVGPVERVAETDSTNRVLLDRARAGGAAGAVLVADRQTAGRGRLGRRWEAPPGSSLLVSVLLRPALAPAYAHLAAVAAALAARAACRDAAGVTAGLKWPNDRVVGERKLAGFLSEALVAGDRLDAVVVGMGLNVRWPRPLPDELAGTATDLVAEAPPGRAVDRDEVLDAWLAELGSRLPLLDDPAGRRQLADEHRAACVTLGRRVRVERPHDVLVGDAVDLADDGSLLVRTPDGTTHRVPAGDVIHLRPA
jgi:BirA family biotin operon repressor/biotin-[acetyl-CoA-carboxylase] ligase